MEIIPHILAIDSSASTLKIGLSLESGQIAKLSNADRFRHAEFIFILINRLLGENNLAANQLRGIVVSTGPGSFTGLRVGLASAKGLAVSLGIPLVGFSNYTASAGRIFGEYGLSAVLTPSRRGEFYLGLVESETFADESITIISSVEIPIRLKNYPIIGIDFGRLTRETYPVPDFKHFETRIDDFITIGSSRLFSGDDKINTLEPLYIQNFQPGKTNE